MSFIPRPPPGMMGAMPPHPPPVFSGVPPPPMPPHMVGAPPMRPRQPFVARPRGPPPNMSSNGPSVTVFVGNISERAQDAMVRSILSCCGPINNWKRVQGATGKLQAFGFCEYGSPEHAIRAIRILHDYCVGDKNLVVKVDAKTQDMLNNYKKTQHKNATGKSPTSEEKDTVNDDDKQTDKMTLDQIKAILREHEKEMNSFVPLEGYQKPRENNPEWRHSGPKQLLDDVDMEDNKRDIIHREIDKFREIMKIREAEKEEEKKKREKEVSPEPPRIKEVVRREASKERESRARDEKSSEGRKEREKSARHRHSPSRSPTRNRSVSPRVERSSRSQSHRVRERKSRSRSWSRSRSRSRERRDTRDRVRERDRDTPGRKSSRELWKEEEIEEEAKERKKAERKARDKEASYQERLRRWEDREVRRVKDYEKEQEKEKKRIEDQEKDAKKLKQFLEDYDDDRDDSKFYKGTKLEQRLGDRNRELQKDVEDRQCEKEEIEELRAQIVREGFKDPNAELERRLAMQERFNNPALFFQQQQLQNQQQYVEVIVDDDDPRENHQKSLSKDEPTLPRFERAPQAAPPFNDHDEDDDDDGGHFEAAPSPTYSHNSNSNSGYRRSPEAMSPSDVPLPTTKAPTSASKSPSGNRSSHQAKQSFQMNTSSRKKIDVKDVFNQEDEEASANKKRKLPIPTTASSAHDKKSKDSGSDDKRKHIKTLIDKIPTDKKALFDYKIEWDLVDNILMEKRIRPWVSKKIAEYIGEPEPTLSDFICTKVLAGSSPKAVLEDVQMVLDDEAEVFVVKLWRLLIYEIENKKLKATITTASTSN